MVSPIEEELDRHVVPVNDLAAHEKTPACPCKPTVEYVERPDGGYGRMFTHKAWDRREQSEGLP